MQKREPRRRDKTAQNSAGTAARRQIGRPFSKGKSGNPGGRPRGFSAYIREATAEGEELVDFALAVLRNRRANLKLRLDAATWLADRGFGRPTQALVHADKDGDSPMDKIPLALLQDVMRKADEAIRVHGADPLGEPWESQFREHT